jgi:hypothetical protein
MDEFIIDCLKTKPHNNHFLLRYIAFIINVSKSNSLNGITGYTERHHILPKARDMFPEYKSFSLHPWNCLVLTGRQHFIAHLLLYKSFGNSQACAFKRMYESKQNTGRLTSHQYQVLKEYLSVWFSKQNTGLKRSTPYCKTLSDAKKAFYSVPSNREKQSLACKGKKRSVEARANISAGAKKRPKWTQEQRDNLSAQLKGKPASEGQKRYMRERNPKKGKLYSEDERRNLSEKIKSLPKLECFNCKKFMDPRNYSRWHGDKCRG